jgi:hypothetical protein
MSLFFAIQMDLATSLLRPYPYLLPPPKVEDEEGQGNLQPFSNYEPDLYPHFSLVLTFPHLSVFCTKLFPFPTFSFKKGLTFG